MDKTQNETQNKTQNETQNKTKETDRSNLKMKAIKRYLPLVAMVLTLGLIFLVNIELGMKSIKIVTISLKEMILVIPPVFILMGLMDVWVPKETIIKHLGEKSGMKGILLAFILGSVAAGPLYGAFPVAGILLKKRASFFNIAIFIGAWSTTKIPLVLFEISSLGLKFALTRFIVDVIGIIVIAKAISLSLKPAEIEAIYAKHGAH